MNNDDVNMNDLLKKAQDMINNNQVPDELKDLMNKASEENSSKDKLNFSNIDINTLNQVKNLMGNFQSPNNQNNESADMSKLLLALKPYLRDKKKGKIDEYINLVKMGKMANLFNLMGGDKKWIFWKKYFPSQVMGKLIFLDLIFMKMTF